MFPMVMPVDYVRMYQGTGVSVPDAIQIHSLCRHICLSVSGKNLVTFFPFSTLPFTLGLLQCVHEPGLYNVGGFCISFVGVVVA